MKKLAANVAKGMINDAIARNLDVKSILSTSRTFSLADLGCAEGPNTFVSVQELIDLIKGIYQSQCPNNSDQIIPKFQVLFNDRPTNDFNTLFLSLPQDREYYAAGVPGSFYGRLFPDSSVHLVHASYALHWLSKLPEEVQDRNSPAWNKGRIHYASAPDEVVKAYAKQWAKDLNEFLDARAQEIVPGGILVVVMHSAPDGMPYSELANGIMYNHMASILLDLAKEGLLKEEQVDAFNLPVYAAPPGEFSAVVQKDGNFNILAMGSTNPSPWLTEGVHVDMTEFIRHIRAAMDVMFIGHFSIEVLNKMFGRLEIQLSKISLQLERAYRDKIQANYVLQRIDIEKELIDEIIEEKLEIISSTSKCNPSTFCIADMGCSTGPRTFYSVQNILEAVTKKLTSQGLACDQFPEFQIYFNDLPFNNFNTLFQSLPPERQYFAAGVPGSFFHQLFPGRSLHFVHCAYALQWMSQVPDRVLDKGSPAWNKGNIHYVNASQAVEEAFAAQFAEDVGLFLDARAKELVDGGLMVLTLPSHPDGVPYSRTPTGILFHHLGSCLNGCFSIEKVVCTGCICDPDNRPTGATIMTPLRAGMEGIINQHFGDEDITNELFDRMLRKSEELIDLMVSSVGEG
ncbi:hypothetical protein Tsubulata_036907, partial [Turnera subulata]